MNKYEMVILIREHNARNQASKSTTDLEVFFCPFEKKTLHCLSEKQGKKSLIFYAFFHP